MRLSDEIRELVPSEPILAAAVMDLEWAVKVLLQENTLLAHSKYKNDVQRRYMYDHHLYVQNLIKSRVKL